jgi:hypothetical protein
MRKRLFCDPGRPLTQPLSAAAEQQQTENNKIGLKRYVIDAQNVHQFPSLAENNNPM